MRTRWLVPLAFLLVSYYRVFGWLYERFTAPDTFYGHGFLVPLVSGYLLWQKRSHLTEIPAIDLVGAFCALTGILVHMLGIWASIYGLSAWALPLIIYGGLRVIAGKNANYALFPVILLVFMLPLPVEFLNAATVPLRETVTAVAVEMARMVDIPATREGFRILLPEGVLSIDNPCSGLRSLIAFTAIGSVMAYTLNRNIFVKLLVVVNVLFVALFVNSLRVVSLTLIAYYNGVAAVAGFWHTGTGYIAYALALGLCAVVYRRAR